MSLTAAGIPAEGSSDVQKELVRSVGAVGNEAAKSALAQVTQSVLNIEVRQAAIQELGRKSGAGALTVLERSLSDPNEAIRRNAVTAVARVNNGPAIALLQRIVASDASSACKCGPAAR